MRKGSALFPGLFIAVALLFSTGTAGAETPHKALKTPEAYSYYLLEKARNTPGPESIELIQEAIRVEPDNPAAYFEFFDRTFSLDVQNFFHSLNYLFKGIAAYPESFWWFFNLAGILSGGMLIAIMLISVIIALARLPLDIPLMAHEIQEDAKKAAFLLVLITAFFGPFYFFASLCFLSFLHLEGRARFAGYVLLLLLMFASLLTIYLGSYLAASFSPDIKAMVAVNEGRSNVYAIEVLEDKEEVSLKFSHALALQREGRVREAAGEYRELLSLWEDPRIYINLGNCYAGMKQLDRAMEMYNASIDMKPLASAYYNLSVLAREKIDFEAADRYFRQATDMAFDRITRFRELRGDDGKPDLMDEALSTAELLSFAIGRGVKEMEVFSARGLVGFMPYSLLLMVILYVSRDSRTTAMRCQKCGKLYCHACERSLSREGMCTECFRSMISFETNPSERVDTIVKTYNYLKKRRQILNVLAFTVPGLTLLYSGRMLSGIFFSFVFLFSASSLVLTRLFTFNIYPYGHSWLTFLLLLLLVCFYIASNVYTVGRLKKGWL